MVVFAALQLNVGISHVEQMGERGLNKLSIPGLIIRAIVAPAWGNLSEEGRMALVGRFREDLEYCDSGNFRVGAMCDVRDMLFVTFQGSPTFC